MSHASTLSHENGLPGKGPCGQPCDHPCEEPCQPGVETFWQRLFKASLWNTLDICFDDVLSEPKKILIVGGCRQMDLSQRLALLLPAADITLVDPDEAIAQKAKEEVCCRFKFIAAPLEQLPFEASQFDLTIAHNFLAYPQQNWRRALSELGRVTGKNLFLSVHRPWLWSALRALPGACYGMNALGVQMPQTLPEKFELLMHLHLYAKIKSKLAPLPWTVYMTEMRPDKEEKLTFK